MVYRSHLCVATAQRITIYWTPESRICSLQEEMSHTGLTESKLLTLLHIKSSHGCFIQLRENDTAHHSYILKDLNRLREFHPNTKRIELGEALGEVAGRDTTTSTKKCGSHCTQTGLTTTRTQTTPTHLRSDGTDRTRNRILH